MYGKTTNHTSTCIYLSQYASIAKRSKRWNENKVTPLILMLSTVLHRSSSFLSIGNEPRRSRKLCLLFLFRVEHINAGNWNYGFLYCEECWPTIGKNWIVVVVVVPKVVRKFMENAVPMWWTSFYRNDYHSIFHSAGMCLSLKLCSNRWTAVQDVVGWFWRFETWIDDTVSIDVNILESSNCVPFWSTTRANLQQKKWFRTLHSFLWARVC